MDMDGMPEKLLTPTCATSPRVPSKKEWMMHIILASRRADGVATECPPSDILYKAENILKTKGRERQFSSAKAENILKPSRLQ
jgi:hypothetical protein